MNRGQQSREFQTGKACAEMRGGEHQSLGWGLAAEEGRLSGWAPSCLEELSMEVGSLDMIPRVRGSPGRVWN